MASFEAEPASNGKKAGEPAAVSVAAVSAAAASMPFSDFCQQLSTELESSTRQNGRSSPLQNGGGAGNGNDEQSHMDAMTLSRARIIFNASGLRMMTAAAHLDRLDREYLAATKVNQAKRNKKEAKKQVRRRICRSSHRRAPPIGGGPRLIAAQLTPADRPRAGQGQEKSEEEPEGGLPLQSLWRIPSAAVS